MQSPGRVKNRERRRPGESCLRHQCRPFRAPVHTWPAELAGWPLADRGLRTTPLARNGSGIGANSRLPEVPAYCNRTIGSSERISYLLRGCRGRAILPRPLPRCPRPAPARPGAKWQGRHSDNRRRRPAQPGRTNILPHRDARVLSATAGTMNLNQLDSHFN